MTFEVGGGVTAYPTSSRFHSTLCVQLYTPPIPKAPRVPRPPIMPSTPDANAGDDSYEYVPPETPAPHRARVNNLTTQVSDLVRQKHALEVGIITSHTDFPSYLSWFTLCSPE